MSFLTFGQSICTCFTRAINEDLPCIYEPATMRILLISTICLSLSIICSCKKASEVQPESIVPQATQTGSGLVYFKMDGKDYPGTYTAIAAQEEFIGGHTRMWISMKSLQRAHTKSIVLDCDSLTGIGTYRIGVKRGEFGVSVVDKSRSCDYFDLQQISNCSGWVKVTRADPKKRICSGTFELKTWPVTGLCDTIQISHGVFDLSEI